MRTRFALFLSLAFLLATTPAWAQVGIAGGGIYSDAAVKVDGSDVSTESRTGFQVGVSYATGSFLGVIFGGYYSEKGFDVQDSADRVRLRYVEVPVMGVIRFPVIGRVIGPRLYGGINGAYEVGCDAEAFSLTVEPLCGETNKFDFGLKGGLGVHILMVGLDLSYTSGLTDVAKSDALEIMNRSWALALIIGVG